METERMFFKLRQRKGTRSLLALGALGLVIWFSAPQTIAQTNPPKLQNEVKRNVVANNEATTRDTKGSKTNLDAYMDDECVELGVVAGSCPGKGVCVLGTVSGSPADRAGIQHGDYILSISDKTTNTPMELVTCVTRHKAGEALQVKV